MPSWANHSRFIYTACGLVLLAFTFGCRRAAYSEIYIEQLNSEARLLEDRIYEYDAAYQSLESEVHLLQRDNDRLRDQLAGKQTRLLPTPSEIRSESSEPELLYEPTPKSSTRPSPNPIPDPKSGPERTPPSSNPQKQDDSLDGVKPDFEFPTKSIDSELVPAKIEFSQPPSALQDDPQRSSKTKSIANRASSRRAVVTAAADVDVENDSQDTTDRLEPEVLQTAYTQPVRDASDDDDGEKKIDGNEFDQTSNESALQKYDEHLSLEFVQVQPPNMLDSQLPLDIADKLDARQLFTPNTVSAKKSVDALLQKSDEIDSIDDGLIELVLHPTFTRCFDGDQIAGEESVRVLIQPKSASGKILPAYGELTVVAVDPDANEPNNAQMPLRIGRWTFNRDQLQQYFDPISTTAGYRLELGALKTLPTKQNVVLFVRMEFDDGRKLVNRFAMTMRTDASATPIWTPRISRSGMTP